MTPSDIRAARIADPKSRERDFGRNHGISEGELVAAFMGDSTSRLNLNFEVMFREFEVLGEVMALTRNESAVHEKIGVYDKFVPGKHAAMMLGAQIDTRMFPAQWTHAFAVTRASEGEPRRSIQFFDRHGEAVHKIHARPSTDIGAWQAVIARHLSADQTEGLPVVPKVREVHAKPDSAKIAQLREGWAAMTDTHQFFPLLRKLEIERIDAIQAAGDDFVSELADGAVEQLFHASVEDGLPIMCFVGNEGCIQIHSGPIHNVKRMGPWLNVMDETFHLHLRKDHITEVFAVRKPTEKGSVHSVEAYDKDGNLIIQFFGKRIEGHDERPEWRNIVHSLPRRDILRAA
jgi:putative hemin transport protein